MNGSEISAKLKVCLVQLLFANGYNSPGPNCTCRISSKATLIFMAIKRYSIKMARLSFKMVKKNKNKKNQKSPTRRPNSLASLPGCVPV